MYTIHKIIFFDENRSNIESYKKILASLSTNFQFEHMRFENLVNKEKIHLVISPANSYLSMTGGIDNIFRKIFPNIEEKLRSKMVAKAYAKSTITYRGTNHILPIGKTILCETNNSKCPFILASPTMIMPKDINGTNNIYLCMRAILKKISMINIPIVIACPCLGTGIGNLSAKDSAKQIKDALIELNNSYHI